jgi:hypothetical protein
MGLMGSIAVAAPPRPVTTTQRAVISDKAYGDNDPLVTKTPQAAVALTATKVTANFSATPAMQAFAELAKQTGYRIELSDRGGQQRFGNVTARISDQPFWAAMREVCTRSNSSLYMWGGEDDREKIPIMPSNYGSQDMIKAAASIMGPYMTLVTNLQRQNSVQLSAPDTTKREIQIQIYTFAEPKALPLRAAYEPQIDEAMDDNGNSMLPTEPRDARSNMQGPQGIAWYGYIRLPYPEKNPGKKIAKLRGHMPAVVQLGSEPLDVPDPLKATEVSKTVGGQRVTFKSLKKREDGQGRAPQQYVMEMVLYRDGKDQQEFQQNFNITPTMKLTDSKGGTFQYRNNGGRGDGESITRTFNFYRTAGGGRGAPPAEAGGSGTNEPVKLVIQIPSATQELNIPFELVDLPMP